MLLFVFWYCHKRGKEVRLAKERDLTEQEVERLDEEYRATHPSLRTTAEAGASMEEIKAGIAEAEEGRRDGEAANAATVDCENKQQSTPAPQSMV